MTTGADGQPMGGLMGPPSPAMSRGFSAARGKRWRTRSRREPAGKPGSVVDSHSSRARVTACLKRPTRERRGPRHGSPIWPCSGWGLPCRPCYHRRGALLPHLFTLTRHLSLVSPLATLTPPYREADAPTARIRRIGAGGIFSVALSVGLRPPGVTWHPALWSPDFPPRTYPSVPSCPDHGNQVTEG